MSQNHKELSKEIIRRGPKSSYKAKFCQEVQEQMALGKKDCQLAVHFGISESTFYKWRRENTDFEEAYQKGLAACEKWWEDEGMRQMQGGEKGKFNHWISFMNRKFKWAGKETGTTNNTQININTMNILQSKSDQELIDYIQNSLNELQGIYTEEESIDAEIIDLIKEQDDKK
jgi:hypothetical protein